MAKINNSVTTADIPASRLIGMSAGMRPGCKMPLSDSVTTT